MICVQPAQRRPNRRVVPAALASVCAAVFLYSVSLDLLMPAWLGGMLRSQDAAAIDRRMATGALIYAATSSSALLGSLEAASAESSDPKLKENEGKTKDFKIQIPETWNVNLDDYPGRMLTAVDPKSFDGGEFGGLRVSRIPLSGLLRLGNIVAREGDEKCSNWNEVVGTNFQPAKAAETLMRAGAEVFAQMAGQRAPDVDIVVSDSAISAGKNGASELFWHSRTTLATNRADPFSKPAASEASVPNGLISSCKAMLRGGVITFTILQASKTSPYFDSVVKSLELTATVADEKS